MANAYQSAHYYRAMTDELGASRDLAQAVEGLYAGIVEQDRMVPELIALLQAARP